MKEITFFIRKEDLTQVTEILRKHKVGGISFYDINGAGGVKRDEIPEMVRSYMTGRKITPGIAQRTKVETVVPDSKVNQIVDEILNSLRPGEEVHGLISIKGVSNAIEIGTNLSGEAVLSAK